MKLFFAKRFSLLLKVIFSCFIFLSVFSGYDKSFCFPGVTIEELLKHPEEFNSQQIEVYGEVVGDLIGSQGLFWVNITSNSMNIGVFSKNKDFARDIKYWGDYRNKGDRIKVRGRFHKELPSQPYASIEVESLEIIESGSATREVISQRKMKSAAICLIICLATGLIYFIKLKYERRN